MRWSEIPPQRQSAIVEAAAMHLAAGDEDGQETPVSRVTVADVADYARGTRSRLSDAALRSALRADPAMRSAFDALLDRYAILSVPLAAAASSGEPGRRRHVEAAVEIEWLQSSAEPNTMFVRVHAPASMRPLSELVLRGEDGALGVIRLVDDGDEIEVLVERGSPEFALLVDEGSNLWLR